MRNVILVPASEDDAKSIFWRNFVRRLTIALEREQLTCRILDTADQMIAEEKAEEEALKLRHVTGER